MGWGISDDSGSLPRKQSDANGENGWHTQPQLTGYRYCPKHLTYTLFYSSQQSNEVDAVIISILQMGKRKHREVTGKARIWTQGQALSHCIYCPLLELS